MSETTGGPVLYTGADMREADVRRLPAGQTAVFSRPRPDEGRVNEDSAAVIPFGEEATVLVVADGAGGQPAGDQASARAVAAMAALVAEGCERGDHLRVAVLDGFERASAAVGEIGGGAATTMAVVTVEGAVIRAYHAGDSPILVVGQRGRIKLQTTSHSPVGYAVASGYLDEDEALHHDDRHLILNAIGTSDMHVEVGSPLALAPLDTVLLGSDGLFDNFYTDELVQAIRVGSLDAVARHLADRCHHRMCEPVEGEPSKRDDCSFVLYRPKRRRRRRRRARTGEAATV